MSFRLSSLRPPNYAAIVTLTVALAACNPPADQPVAVDDAPAPQFVGGESCVGCHALEAGAWSGSHHAKAMLPATEDHVLGDFAEVTAEAAGEVYRFYRDGPEFLVRIERDGEVAFDAPITWTLGVEPLQQYLVPTEGGRLQSLGMAWDTRPVEEGGQRWFHVYGDDAPPLGDRLHWAGIDQNWNFMCADCHATGLRKNFNPSTNSFDTSWSDPGVDCEACHGPGSTHAENPAAALPVPFEQITWLRAPGQRVASPDRLPGARNDIEVCAQCHARRSVIADSYMPGQPFLDFHSPAMLSDGLYFADGQIMDEVYVYGSFTQSRMHAAGVGCGDCHEPHSLSLRASGNLMCGTCHEAGTYDTPSHHRHAAGSEAAECVSCHMPDRTYMQIDQRRDHSLRVPRPDLAAATGAPDPCTTCHEDRDAVWAAKEIVAWRGGEPPAPHYGAAFAGARQGDPAHAAEVARLATDESQPPIVRATAVALASGFDTAATFDATVAAVRDPSPLVRRSAAAGLSGYDPATRLRALSRLLDDPVRSVRIEAARALASIPRERFDDESLVPLTSGIDEYIEAQMVNADRPEAWSNLGSLRAGMGDLTAAADAYRRATRIDTGFTAAWIGFAEVRRAVAGEDEALDILRTARQIVREPEWIDHATGLALVRTGERDEALRLLGMAYEKAPAEARLAYVYAVALGSAGRLENAIRVLQENVDRHPFHRDSLIALVNYGREANRPDIARHYAEDLLAQYPLDGDIAALARTVM